ncbi:uncharacterized protein LOC126996052 isoform X4 [Eriocheir sinensis]|uniref:uncharacterized protein LOC126996052 isoform X4 n=1 Tax=Eriocheir sinensis TaxID=95602 RepID=UPI0021C876E5|nr:uncharacterized protein LOC126996052 isoform X4 [Eriocheir sinensis]
MVCSRGNLNMFLWRSRCGTTWRGAAALLLLLLVASISFYYYSYLKSRLPFKRESLPGYSLPWGEVPSVQSEDCIPSRRDLARRLMRAQRQVVGMAGKVDGTAGPSLAHELRAIARELDPRIATEDAAPRPLTSAVCGEVYRGRDVDEACLQNYMQVKCDDAPPFKEVLTVILSTKGWEAPRVRTVVQNIRKYYDLDVVVLSYGSGGDLGTLRGDGVSVRTLSADTSASSAINREVTKVRTPFVLLADSLTHFVGNLCSLERLVRVLDHEGQAGVAAGSYRTLDGTWHHGCLLRRMENYQLAYASGYENSRHECMFCDDVVGPFVARTALLRKLPLRDEMESPATLRDWFISVHISGSLAVVCPDVMFFVDEAPAMTRQEWLQVAAKWAVQHVWPHNGEKLEFSCPELNMECVNLMKMVSSFLVPPCCRDELRRELGLVQECGDELGLYVELQAGSLLGAVKTDGILPWDFDMDVMTDCKDQEAWMEKGTKCMARKGCSAVHMIGNYWMTTCNVSFVDVTCRPERLTPLPPELRGVPTRVNYNGRMIVVPPNPAMVARNYYGPEYLRHEVHWRYTGKDKGLRWNRCAAPGFHACLENFPTDGNIKFRNFAQQLVGL